MPFFKNSNHAVWAAQALFYSNAAIWFLLGILNLAGLTDKNPDMNFFHNTVANFMFGNAGAMLLCAFFIGRHNQNFYFFAIALLCINIMFIIADPLGTTEFIIMLMDLALIGILLIERKIF